MILMLLYTSVNQLNQKLIPVRGCGYSVTQRHSLVMAYEQKTFTSGSQAMGEDDEESRKNEKKSTIGRMKLLAPKSRLGIDRQPK
uniref:Uncharacterized protein n=1 Tax=Anguilla anguilla TaxID=7936 RepID=A0A0E9X5Z5_ANGAN